MVPRDERVFTTIVLRATVSVGSIHALNGPPETTRRPLSSSRPYQTNCLWTFSPSKARVTIILGVPTVVGRHPSGPLVPYLAVLGVWSEKSRQHSPEWFPGECDLVAWHVKSARLRRWFSDSNTMAQDGKPHLSLDCLGSMFPTPHRCAKSCAGVDCGESTPPFRTSYRPGDHAQGEKDDAAFLRRLYRWYINIKTDKRGKASVIGGNRLCHLASIQARNRQSRPQSPTC